LHPKKLIFLPAVSNGGIKWHRRKTEKQEKWKGRGSGDPMALKHVKNSIPWYATVCNAVCNGLNFSRRRMMHCLATLWLEGLPDYAI
jgi:hypothetical protein